MINQIFNEDCLEGMKRIPDGSVDFILTDLPFGITAMKVDKKINLQKMWEQFKRILKPCSSVAMFASGRFTHELIASNFEQFKYKWIWVKNYSTLFVHAKNCPMRRYEEICIFSNGVVNHQSLSPNTRMKYFPQGVVPCQPFKREWQRNNGTQLRNHLDYPKARIDVHGAKKKFGNVVGKRPSHKDFYIQEATGYPSDVLFFDASFNVSKLHPNEKPVDLLEYLIRTYTNEGEVVLDATIGSGSTCVAAVNTGRKFIGFETDKKFFEIAQKRIDEAFAKKEQELFYWRNHND